MAIPRARKWRGFKSRPKRYTTMFRMDIELKEASGDGGGEIRLTSTTSEV